MVDVIHCLPFRTFSSLIVLILVPFKQLLLGSILVRGLKTFLPFYGCLYAIAFGACLVAALV